MLNLALIGPVVAIVIFILGSLFYQLRTLRKEEHKKLKTHFEDLKNGVWDRYVIPMVSSPVHVQGGYYLCPRSQWQESPTFSAETERHSAFRKHFPKAAKEWDKCENKVSSYYVEYSLLRTAILVDLASKNLRVLTFNPANPLPYIDNRAFEALFRSWVIPTLAPLPRLNIGQAQIELNLQNIYELTLHGLPLAFAQDKEHCIGCRIVLLRLAKKEAYQQEAIKLSILAAKLGECFEELNEHFGDTFEYMSKYGPGKQFKKLKDCPICKEIFYGKKSWWQSLKFWS